MNQCREAIRKIRESAGELDRETVAHCVRCAACRRELLGVLAGDIAPVPPPELDRRVLALGAAGRRWRRRAQWRRAAAWGGALAAAAGLAVMVRAPFDAPPPLSPADSRLVVRVSDAEWEGRGLLLEISEIDSELGRVRQLLAGEMI